TRDRKPAHVVHRHYAGVALVSTAVPIDAPPAVDPKLLDKLHALADAKDYEGILVVAGDQSDPAIASIVAGAKTEYLAAQTKEIAEHAARGECAQATLEAGEGAKILPDATPQFDKAAIC